MGRDLTIYPLRPMSRLWDRRVNHYHHLPSLLRSRDDVYDNSSQSARAIRYLRIGYSGDAEAFQDRQNYLPRPRVVP